MKRIYRPLIAMAVVAGVIVLWILTIGPAQRASGIGRYGADLLIANMAASYLALLSCYVVLGRPSWKRRLANAGINLAAILVVLLLIETPAMLGFVDYRTVMTAKEVGASGRHNMRLDRELLHTRPPHDRFVQDARSDIAVGLNYDTGVRYRFEWHGDRNGFRNSRDLRRAPVVLIGDSFIDGYKVAQEEVCSSRLGEILGVDICNLGQCDYGLAQELVVLRRLAVKLRPRVVVWFFCEGNDLQLIEEYRAAVGDWEAYVGRVDGSWPRSFCCGVRNRVEQWLEAQFVPDLDEVRRNSAPLRAEIPGDSVTMYFGAGPHYVSRDYEASLLNETQDVLREAQAICDGNDIRFLVAMIPVRFRVYRDLCEFAEDSPLAECEPNDTPQRLRRRCRDARIKYLDLTLTLKAAAQEGKLVYLADDDHWSPEGHAVVAEEIAGYIRERDWLEWGAEKQKATGR